MQIIHLMYTSTGTLKSPGDTRAPVPFPCDEGEPPFSDYMKGEFLPLESRCDTGTLIHGPMNKKVGKFFAINYPRVLKHAENLFWKKVEKFFDLHWHSQIAMGNLKLESQSPFHVIRSESLFLWLQYVEGVPSIGISLPHRNSDSTTKKVGNFFSLKIIPESWNTGKLCLKRVQKFSDL